jgi:hypothetical protein
MKKIIIIDKLKEEKKNKLVQLILKEGTFTYDMGYIDVKNPNSNYSKYELDIFPPIGFISETQAMLLNTNQKMLKPYHEKLKSIYNMI